MLMHLERMVGSSAWGRVVASTMTALLSGSSSVFRMAFWAWGFSRSAGSMTKTLRDPSAGGWDAWVFSQRICWIRT